MEIVPPLCIACADCKDVCPSGAIVERAGVISINPDGCTECEGHHDEPRCVEACPTEGCIVPGPA